LIERDFQNGNLNAIQFLVLHLTLNLFDYFRYLTSTMSYLLTCLQRKDKDRQLALVTIGYLAVCVEGDIAKYLPKIVEFIAASLPHKVIFKLYSWKCAFDKVLISYRIPQLKNGQLRRIQPSLSVSVS